MSEFDIVDVPSMPCLYIKGTVPQQQLGEFFMGAIPKLFEYASARNAVGGAPSARYTDWREADCDVEAFVPTTSAVEGEGDVIAGDCGGFRAIHTTHKGPYEKLTETHMAVHAHVMEKGYQMAGAPTEVYVDDPGTVAPDECRTEIYWPVSL